MNTTTKCLKSITMPLDKCEIFLTMENEEVGEMVKDLLGFVLKGSEPTIRNKWQKIVYDTFAFEIKHQMESYESRRTNCSLAKGGQNKNKSLRRSGTKPGIKEDTMHNGITESDASTINKTEVIHDEPTSSNVIEGHQEDLTFATFAALYEKMDTGNYDTETIWNALSDEDKHNAIAYVKENLVNKVYSCQRDYPSKFLSNHPWNK